MTYTIVTVLFGLCRCLRSLDKHLYMPLGSFYVDGVLSPIVNRLSAWKTESKAFAIMFLTNIITSLKKKMKKKDVDIPVG